MHTDLTRSLPFPTARQRPGRFGALAVIVAVHALLLWGLARSLDWHPADAVPAPLLVLFVRPSPQPPAPPEVVLPQPARTAVPVAPPLPLPVVQVATPEPAAPLLSARPAPEPPVAAAPAAPASAPPPPAAPVERQIVVTQVEYLTPPVLSYPLASRRLREQGQAQVRVRVDEQGRPDRVLLLRSTGSERLDEAALATVRATRFKPYTEGGAARPFWVEMPLIFELDT